MLNPVVLGVPACLIRLVSHPHVLAYLIQYATPACLIRSWPSSSYCTGLLNPVCHSGLLNPESAIIILLPCSDVLCSVSFPNAVSHYLQEEALGPGPNFEWELARERRLYPFKKSLGPVEAAARREGANLTNGDWTDLQGLYPVLSHHLGRRTPVGISYFLLFVIDTHPLTLREC